ncbi:hypothetical protein SAY87_022812 [Trapa incisa]|uniref:X8 domain-containing protein n=1 Tax=Trapa incisa TaxID=236973 RepID=A0AAN7K7T9_9MYRT|nr:hypothetical protein SAY87_022812 [Trapa incisa]
MLQAALDWAYGAAKMDCTPLMQGESCYEPEPDTVVTRATYALNSDPSSRFKLLRLACHEGEGYCCPLFGPT